MKPLRATPGWLTGIALAAVAAVNLAGLWGIHVARQGALDEARRAFALDIGAKATALEGRLSEVRSDLAFLGASPTIARLDESGKDPSAASLLRQAAESALLLFLRSHAEVVRIEVRSSSGRPLVHVGRRGGVPVLWVSTTPTGLEGAAIDPTRPRLTARLPHGEAALPLAGRRDDRDRDRRGHAARPGRARRGLAAAVPAGRREGCPAGSLPARTARPAAGQDDRRARGGAGPRGGLVGGRPARPLVRAAGADGRGPGGARVGPLSHDLHPQPRGHGAGAAPRGVCRAAGPPSRGARGPGRGGEPGARARAAALPRRAAHHRRPPGRRHRPRDQQPPRGHVELPDPGPGRAHPVGRRGGLAPRRLGEAGARARGGDRAAGAGPRRPREGPEDPGRSQPGAPRDRAVRAVAKGVPPRELRRRALGGAAGRPRQPRDARTGGDEPHRERLRGPAGPGGGAGHLAPRRRARWWRSSPTGGRASRRPTASACSSRSSRPRTRPASGCRSVIPSCGSTRGSSTSLPRAGGGSVFRMRLPAREA